MLREIGQTGLGREQLLQKLTQMELFCKRIREALNRGDIFENKLSELTLDPKISADVIKEHEAKRDEKIKNELTQLEIVAGEIKPVLEEPKDEGGAKP